MLDGNRTVISLSSQNRLCYSIPYNEEKSAALKAVKDISEQDLKGLVGILAEYPFIASAYVFGSVASGKAGPMSDVDIALLLRHDAPSGKDLIHTEDYLAYRIAKELGVREVDIVDLNRQGLVFQHQVLKSGR